MIHFVTIYLVLLCYFGSWLPCWVMGEATKIDASQSVAEVSSCPNCSKGHLHIALWLADAQLAYRTILEFVDLFDYPSAFGVHVSD